MSWGAGDWGQGIDDFPKRNSIKIKKNTFRRIKECVSVGQNMSMKGSLRLEMIYTILRVHYFLLVDNFMIFTCPE